MTIEPPSYYSNHSAFSTNVVGVPNKKDNTQSLNVWHKKLSHVHHNMIKKMEAKDIVDGLVINGSGEDPPLCRLCLLKKITKCLSYGRNIKRKLKILVIWFIVISMDPSTHPLLAKQIILLYSRMTTLVLGSFTALRKSQLLWNAYEGSWGKC
jgi:hypothetical protein